MLARRTPTGWRGGLLLRVACAPACGSSAVQYCSVHACTCYCCPVRAAVVVFSATIIGDGFFLFGEISVHDTYLLIVFLCQKYINLYIYIYRALYTYYIHDTRVYICTVLFLFGRLCRFFFLCRRCSACTTTTVVLQQALSSQHQFGRARKIRQSGYLSLPRGV